MRFFVLCFGLIVAVSGFSFAQQQTGNLKILNHQEPLKKSNTDANPTLEGIDKGGLNVAGWKFVRPPKPKDNSSESGKIVFQIEVNKEGNVIACKVLESSVSNNLMRLYRDAVLKSKLKPTNLETEPVSGASGTVTFIITSR